jgi:hypothetical protein
VPLQFAELVSRSNSLTLQQAPGLCVDTSSACSPSRVATQSAGPGSVRDGKRNVNELQSRPSPLCPPGRRGETERFAVPLKQASEAADGQSRALRTLRGWRDRRRSYVSDSRTMCLPGYTASGINPTPNRSSILCATCELRLFIGHQLVEKPSQQFSWSATTRQSSAGPRSSRPNSGRA